MSSARDSSEDDGPGGVRGGLEISAETEGVGAGPGREVDSWLSTTSMGGAPAAPGEVAGRIGAKLAGRFTILEQIGQGGMGVVYLGKHDLLTRKIAIKLLRKGPDSDEEARERFHREAMAAAGIGDPHVIDILDYGTTDDGESFLVMEYLEGQSLRQAITRWGAMEVDRAIEIARQILLALSAAHEQGIVHRDLKAENVFLTRRDGGDFVKLLDFGISKVLATEDELNLTSTGQVMGTPHYLAPEQAQDFKNVDHRADIYAAGVLLFEMLTGQLPFQGSTAFELMKKHMQEAPPPPSDVRPDLEIPAGLEAVVMRAMSKGPDDRFASARDMAGALTTYRSSDLLRVAARPPRRRVLPLLLALALCLGVGGVLLALRYGAAPPDRVRRAAPVPPGPADLPPPPGAAADLSAPRPPMVEQTLEVVPKHARVYIDDRLRGVGRVRIWAPVGKVFRVRIIARGHEALELTHTVSRTVGRMIRLKPRRRAVGTKKRSTDLRGNPYEDR